MDKERYQAQVAENITPLARPAIVIFFGLKHDKGNIQKCAKELSNVISCMGDHNNCQSIIYFWGVLCSLLLNSRTTTHLCDYSFG
ncbi:hypothetical protein LJY18_08380 [Pseudomonas sp. MMS21-TM103]|uniref:hypothetical protein n=1 Tax=Pseudomonas sp. MMS21 TM103 TaxID=2886506 RepID=UPI001EDCEE88|nr:hypothetical protein [Pseudomonas sp. MMS21 TM103]MCG4453323.1 hypothetical protein [Pseudomonas sp. MMS21 TM103]